MRWCWDSARNTRLSSVYYELETHVMVMICITLKRSNRERRPRLHDTMYDLGWPRLSTIQVSKKVSRTLHCCVPLCFLNLHVVSYVSKTETGTAPWDFAVRFDFPTLGIPSEGGYRVRIVCSSSCNEEKALSCMGSLSELYG